MSASVETAIKPGDYIVWESGNPSYRRVRTGLFDSYTFDGLCYVLWKWQPYSSAVRPEDCRLATAEEIKEFTTSK